jgi:hypothetical protein
MVLPRVLPTIVASSLLSFEISPAEFRGADIERGEEIGVTVAARSRPPRLRNSSHFQADMINPVSGSRAAPNYVSRIAAIAAVYE